MKKITLILSLFLMISCENKYTYIGQEIIDGKVSAIEPGRSGGRTYIPPRIWIQSPTQTKMVEIPFKYEKRWKVGDSCLLVIKIYKENK